MKVLIIGGGGREHALAYKAQQSERVSHVFVAPGNAGIAEDGMHNVPIAADDIDGLKQFAIEEKIDLSIVGPEVPLVHGIVDEFSAVGLSCFGPSRKAAMLENSKSYTKAFLKRHHIPTADYATFNEFELAKNYIRDYPEGKPIVIKADGLAAGKGVIITSDKKEAIAVAQDILQNNRFGDAGHRIVIEEYLEGRELSFMVVSDGKHIVPLVNSQDYKQRDDHGLGPNTGGMGAYSPVTLEPQQHDYIMDKIMSATVNAMAQENRRYKGFLYAGLMLTEQGIKVLEFNCRLGDPETQVIMQRLNSDLIDLCLQAQQGNLEQTILEWDQRAALVVVMASQGYPTSATKAKLISGLDTIDNDQVKVFHAATSLADEGIMTNGGRVLGVTALGDDRVSARQVAYDAIKHIQCDYLFCRQDIGVVN